jgi:hypothetical protein
MPVKDILHSIPHLRRYDSLMSCINDLTVLDPNVSPTVLLKPLLACAMNPHTKKEAKKRKTAVKNGRFSVAEFWDGTLQQLECII